MGGHDVLIYYWHDDEDPEDSGWWFGPNVGGNQVWAFNPKQDVATPPSFGWIVPHDAELDQSFVLKPVESWATKSINGPAPIASVPAVMPVTKGKLPDRKTEGSKMAEKRKRQEEEDRKKWEEELKRKKEG